VSEKTKKESKATGKASSKARPAGKASKKATPPAMENGPKTAPPTAKPLVTSNSEETGISGLLLTLLLVTVVAAGGFATQSLWMPYVIDYLPGLKKTTLDEPPQAALVERLGDIEKEVSQVRQSGEAIADLETQRERMNQTFEGVMARIVELEKQIDYVRGMLQATSPPSDAVNTNESLQRLSTRMNTLEASDETVNAVMERLVRLEKAMADSGANTNSSAEQLANTMEAISMRLGSLESGAAGSAADEARISARSQQQVRAQTLVLAVGHLRETLRSSAPFVQALGALRALGEGDPDIMRGVGELAPYADIGIVTLDGLRRDFTATADAIAQAAPEPLPADREQGVLDDVLSTVTSLVSVRKVGAPSSAKASQGPVEKAGARLANGDLEGAVALLSTLEGAQVAAAAPWLDKARARLSAETVLSKLHVFVVSLLAPASQ